MFRSKKTIIRYLACPVTTNISAYQIRVQNRIKHDIELTTQQSGNKVEVYTTAKK
jgi:hypothetical protein